MAKVSMPLMSGNASGRFGALVFDRRGIVRRFVPPGGTPTTSQTMRRVIFRDCVRGLSAIRQHPIIAEVQRVYGSFWYAFLLADIIRKVDYQYQSQAVRNAWGALSYDLSPWSDFQVIAPADMAYRLGTILAEKVGGNYANVGVPSVFASQFIGAG